MSRALCFLFSVYLLAVAILLSEFAVCTVRFPEEAAAKVRGGDNMVEKRRKLVCVGQ